MDADLDSLLEDLRGLFSQEQSPSVRSQSADVDKGYQCPIRGSWSNLGGFSSSPSPRHPNGHQGLDLRAPGGTAIYPLSPGVVTFAGSNPKGGNVVNVQHANGVKTYYAHMASASVHKGDKVGYDTVLGIVGSSGNAKNTSSHLHFQVWKNNQLLDPAGFFSVPAYSKKQSAFSNKVDKLVKIASDYLAFNKAG